MTRRVGDCLGKGTFWDDGNSLYRGRPDSYLGVDVYQKFSDGMLKNCVCEVHLIFKKEGGRKRMWL